MAKKNDTTFFENKLLDFVTAKDPMLEMLQWVMDKFMEIEVAHRTGAEKGMKLLRMNLGNCYIFGDRKKRNVPEGLKQWACCCDLASSEIEIVREMSNERYLNCSYLKLTSLFHSSFFAFLFSFSFCG